MQNQNKLQIQVQDLKFQKFELTTDMSRPLFRLSMKFKNLIKMPYQLEIISDFGEF